MGSILEELYHGNLSPNEQIVPDNPGYWPLRRKVSGMMDVWKKKLSAENSEQFENLLALRSRLSSMEDTASFVYGFQLGARMMMEVLSAREGGGPTRE